MRRHKLIATLALSVLMSNTLVLWPSDLHAHCDTLAGPVVTAARKALETGNVSRILIWVQRKDEAEIKEAFQKAMAIRKLNPEARELADRYFFETVVRVHRAGEGAPYTGLKPADADLGPAIPCADKALETGKMGKLLELLTDATKEGLEEHFKNAMAKKNFKVDDVEAGREYVEAYVKYVHYVERLYEAAAHPAEGHYPESETGAEQKD